MEANFGSPLARVGCLQFCAFVWHVCRHRRVNIGARDAEMLPRQNIAQGYQASCSIWVELLIERRHVSERRETIGVNVAILGMTGVVLDCMN